MKLWKKAKELLSHLAGSDDSTPPPAAPAADPAPEARSEEVQDPRYSYRREQRDFERRAKARSVFWDSAARGTYRRDMVSA